MASGRNVPPEYDGDSGRGICPPLRRGQIQHSLALLPWAPAPGLPPPPEHSLGQGPRLPAWWRGALPPAPAPLSAGLAGSNRQADLYLLPQLASLAGFLPGPTLHLLHPLPGLSHPGSQEAVPATTAGPPGDVSAQTQPLILPFLLPQGGCHISSTDPGEHSSL